PTEVLPPVVTTEPTPPAVAVLPPVLTPTTPTPTPPLPGTAPAAPPAPVYGLFPALVPSAPEAQLVPTVASKAEARTSQRGFEAVTNSKA
ncbi:MAG TPA: hypothetical protein VHU80_23435, partial [Polyangiaceae bacterium]|nr:hypothetical protein [Polyangiaceae bacterium]